MSIYKKKPFTEKHKKNISKAMKGRKITEEHKRKLSDAKKGKYFSKEHKEKLSKAKIGKKHSKKWNKKISESHKGEKSHFWKGGISFEPYSVDWKKTLKRAIRERDHYVCQICGEQQGDKSLDVHHIDYDKQNCNPNNLITLCHSCHSKTNFNREYWINYFKK